VPYCMILVTVSGTSIIVLRTGNLLRPAAGAIIGDVGLCAGNILGVDSPMPEPKRHRVRQDTLGC